MADGDSGIDGELGNHVEETVEENGPQENGDDHDEGVNTAVESAPQIADPDEDRPVVELFVKVNSLSVAFDNVRFLNRTWNWILTHRCQIKGDETTNFCTTTEESSSCHTWMWKWSSIDSCQEDLESCFGDRAWIQLHANSSLVIYFLFGSVAWRVL